MRLKDRVAIVTGGAGGIGRGIVSKLLSEGAKVAIADLGDDRMRPVVEELGHDGGTVRGWDCDVTSRERIAVVVAEVVDAFGPVDILVNTAQGFGAPGSAAAAPPPIPVAEFPDDVWDHTFETGVKGTLYFSQAVFPHMKDRGGRIVNFGSAWGQMGMEGGAAYNAAKEAIRGLSRTMAREWGPHDITVNVINPLVETTALQEVRRDDPERVQSWLDVIPLRRFGTPEDAGKLVAFLASDDADFITGRTMMLDGGRYLFA